VSGNQTRLSIMSTVPPAAQALFNEANEVFVDEDYESALDLYSQVATPSSWKRDVPAHSALCASGCLRARGAAAV
jgi:hypothetical protein